MDSDCFLVTIVIAMLHSTQKLGLFPDLKVKPQHGAVFQSLSITQHGLSPDAKVCAPADNRDWVVTLANLR